MSDPRALTFLTIEDELNAWYFERKPMIRAMTLGLLSGLNFYALGDPGTGKSALVRDFLKRFGGRYFETAMRKQGTADTLVGPYDLAAYKATGEYVRKGEGYIQWAELAFVDEAGKMNAQTGHYLLGIANPGERIFHEVKNGLSVQDVPLISLFAASNELLVTESEDGKALWDRLIVRVSVDPIRERGNFVAMMSREDEPERTTKMSVAELRDCIAEVRMVTIGAEALTAIADLQTAVDRNPTLSVSNRTWRLSRRLVQANAWLSGRDEVVREDLEVLEYVLWDSPEQIVEARELAWTAAVPALSEVIEIAETVTGIHAEIDALEGKANSERSAYGITAVEKVRKIRRDIERLREGVAQTSIAAASKLDDVERRTDDIEVRVLVDCLDWTEQRARSHVAGSKRDAA